ARLDLHWHAVAQQAVNRLVVLVQAAVGVARLNAQQVQGAADLSRRVAHPRQVGGQQRLVDVIVGGAVRPIAKGSVAEFVAEERQDSVPSGAFGLADGAHGCGSPARISLCTYARNSSMLVKNR